MKCKFCGQEMEDTKIGEHYNYRDCAYALQARVKELEAENAALREQVRWHKYSQEGDVKDKKVNVYLPTERA